MRCIIQITKTKWRKNKMVLNPLGSKVFWGSLKCFDMHICVFFFQLLINIMAQVKLHS